MAIERIPGFCALCRSRCGCVSIVEDRRLVGVEADPGWVSIGWELSATGPTEIGARRARVLAQVLKSVYGQESSLVDGRVGFGTSVTVEEADGRCTSYEIVGPDEVEPVGRV